MNMFVSNLSFHTNDENLRTLFSSYGDVISVNVIKDRTSGRSRGFGFVEMANEDQAHEAMKGLNLKEIEGRALSVTVAREKSKKSGFSIW